MTLQNQDSTVTHNGNGLTKVWPYAFRIPDPESLRVGLFDIATSALTLLTPSDFTVTGLGEDNGGEVTYPLGFIDAIGADKRLVIYREVPYTQAIDLTNQTYYPETLEDQLDLIVMQIQKLAEESNRALKVTLGASLEPDEFISQLQAGAAIATEQAGIATTQAAAAIAAAESVDAATIVHYTAETKTEAEQGQARANVGSGVLAGFRNKIINGNFAIWQRGTSFTGNVYTADRWRIFPGTGATFSVARVANNRLRANGKNSMAIQRSAAGSEQSLLVQRIEGVNTLEGGKATLTFHALMEAGTKTFSASLLQVFGDGGTPSGSISAGSHDFTLTTTEQKFSFVFDIPSIAGKSLGTNDNDFLQLAFVFPVDQGTFTSPGGAMFLRDVSLVGGDATAEPDPFSPRHIQQELALCQRYYETSGTGHSLEFSGNVTSGSNYYARTGFAVPKRTEASMIVVNAAATSFSSTPGSSAGGIDGISETRVANATGAGRFNSTWTADAEL